MTEARMKRFGAIVAAFLLGAFGLGLARGGDEGKKDEKTVKKDDKTAKKGDEKKPEKGEEKKGTEEKKGDKGEKGKTYDSPEKAFKAFEAAVKEGNGKAICATLTEDASKLMAGRMAVGGLIMKGFMEKSAIKIQPGKGGKEPPKGGQKGKGKDEEVGELPEPVRALNRTLKKYGLDADALEGVELSKLIQDISQPSAAAPLFRRVEKKIKNRCAFIGEMFRTYKKMTGGKIPPQLGFSEAAELENLKAGEDSATATLVLSGTGAKVSHKISFTREQGGWRIDEPPAFGLPMMMGGPPGGPIGPGGVPPNPKGFPKK